MVCSKILGCQFVVIVMMLLAGCAGPEEATDRLHTPSAAIDVVKEHLSTRTYEVRSVVDGASEGSCEARGGLYHGNICYVHTQEPCGLIDSAGTSWTASFVPADTRGNVTRYWAVEAERQGSFLGKDRLRWLVYEKSGRIVAQTEPAC
jgi:hypothetical protein